MIEISEKQYWKKMNYHDGLLYCQLLEIDDKNDWRMIKNGEEWREIRDNIIEKNFDVWYLDDIVVKHYQFDNINMIIPVRDV